MMTLEQVVRIWTSGRSPITVTIYEGNVATLEKLSQEHFNKSILFLTTSELETVLRIKHASASAVTKNAQIWIMKGFFKMVQKLELRPDNPADPIRPPKFEDKLADRLLSHEQVETLISCATRERDKLLLRLLYGAGLRISEALGLKKKDVLGNGMIRVWGKGGKTAYVRIQEDLDTRMAQWGEALKEDHYLFQSYHGRGLTRKAAHVAIKKIAKQAGLPQVSAHFFRHAHATVALRNGASLPVVQKSLRHSSITTTMRYSHILPSEGAALYLPKVTSK